VFNNVKRFHLTSGCMERTISCITVVVLSRSWLVTVACTLKPGMLLTFSERDWRERLAGWSGCSWVNEYTLTGTGIVYSSVSRPLASRTRGWPGRQSVQHCSVAWCTLAAAEHPDVRPSVRSSVSLLAKMPGIMSSGYRRRCTH